MRTFDNDEAIAMSGLTRGQIDQLISRHGYAVYGSRGARRERYFNATDMFNLMLAGALHDLGMSMPGIRDVLLVALGLYAWDTDADQPAEIYPGQLAAGPGRHKLIIYRWRKSWHTRVVKEDNGQSALGPRGTVAIAIDATGLVERIQEAAAKEHAR